MSAPADAVPTLVPAEPDQGPAVDSRLACTGEQRDTFAGVLRCALPAHGALLLAPGGLTASDLRVPHARS